MEIDAIQLTGLVAGSAVLAALLTHYLGQNERELANRRQLYAEALQSALGWREMLYRVRRRQKGKDDEKVITQQFHSLQEKIDYYDGLIWSYSKSLSKSYRSLVTEIKRTTEPLLREAWKDNPISPQTYDPTASKNPKFKKELDSFMEDVIRQVKPRYHILAKINLWWNNRD